MLSAESLTRDATYSLVVDGAPAGRFPAVAGVMTVDYSSDGSGARALPPHLRPVTSIRRVEVLDESGQTILVAEFPSL
jgi:hypothetical protein